jgi:hypothetical protein
VHRVCSLSANLHELETLALLVDTLLAGRYKRFVEIKLGDVRKEERKVLRRAGPAVM